MDSIKTTMAKTRKQYGSLVSEIYDLLDGDAHIFRHKRSGDVWQFRMWISKEGKHYRKSLKTTDFNTAMSSAKELSRTLSSDTVFGKQIFGITLGELIDEYLEYRDLDVKIKKITPGTWRTLQSHLKHLLRIKDYDTKLSELDSECLIDYEQIRKLNYKKVQDVTIKNEEVTFNHLCEYAYRKGYISFDKFSFKLIKIAKDKVGVRSTFSLKQYDELIKCMRSYVSKKECPDDDKRLERLMIRDYVLISSNTYLRVGEARQLKWGDVEKYETHYEQPIDEVSLDDNDYDYGKEVHLVHLNIRAETSKVRSSRKLITRGGEYFKRLKERQKHTNDEDLVFSMDGKNSLTGMKWITHWKNLMSCIGIFNHKQRKLTWYSLRHFGITMRVKSGVSLIDLAKLAGTSVSHIENTYLKYSEEQSRTAALKNFSINIDGTIHHNE